jgi:16S rRNA (guanine966-N2)-methyltransferase
MRVIAGTARGRRLATPPGRGTRPTGDKVRQAVFNALESLGRVDGATVLDLYAGSGALGIEALSRGAARCTFIESDRAAAAVVRANLAVVAGADATVVTTTVERFLAHQPASADLILIDPPYAFDGWPALLDSVPGDFVVAESDRTLALGPDWEIVRSRAYGGTVVTFARRFEPTPAPDEAAFGLIRPVVNHHEE